MRSDAGGVEAEPIVGAVRGFRWWRLADERLTSPWRGDVRWTPEANIAACLGRRWLLRWKEHGVPHARGIPETECSCGFYAMLDAPRKGVDAPGSWPLNPSLSGGPISLVFGTVRGSGRVVLARYGWRAERAQVDALYVPPSRTPPGPLLDVSDIYEAPIYRDLLALSAERGPDRWTMDLAQNAA
jgi:hypothetical protein